MQLSCGLGVFLKYRTGEDSYRKCFSSFVLQHNFELWGEEISPSTRLASHHAAIMIIMTQWTVSICLTALLIAELLRILSHNKQEQQQWKINNPHSFTTTTPLSSSSQLHAALDTGSRRGIRAEAASSELCYYFLVSGHGEFWGGMGII